MESWTFHAGSRALTRTGKWTENVEFARQAFQAWIDTIFVYSVINIYYTPGVVRYGNVLRVHKTNLTACDQAFCGASWRSQPLVAK